MTVGAFMDSLERQGVAFDLVDGVLQVSAPLGVLSEAQRQELVARRAEVEYLVRLALTPSPPAEGWVAVDEQHAQMPLGQVA
ncbi:MAG TPA: hypothetical protein VIL85_27445 [Thermomicrobiales bacterium]|jgi:hypothetical protein